MKKTLLITVCTAALSLSFVGKEPAEARQRNGKSQSGSPNKPVPNRPGNAEAPSLKDTVSWMTSFLDAHGQEWARNGEPFQSNVMGLAKAYFDLLRTSSPTKLTGKEACVIFIKRTFATPVLLHTDMKVPVTTATELLYFADIDSKSINLSGSHVHFETYNNVDTIVEMVPIGDTFSEYDVNLSNFILDTPENAGRFAAALKHAVGLCGGQASPF